MQAQEIVQRLGAIESDLAAVIESLTHLGFSDRVWPESLRKAGANLESIRFDEGLNADRRTAEQLLRRLSEQTKVAGTLLDSAAALYFGHVLSDRSMECGYLADGAANSIHYGGMRIEG